MIREREGERVGVGYGQGGGADYVEGVAFGMGGEVNVLGEVETVKEREEVRCHWGVGLVHVDVEVTGE